MTARKMKKMLGSKYWFRLAALFIFILVVCLSFPIVNSIADTPLRSLESIAIQVKDQEKLSRVVNVDEEGNVLFPLIGAVRAEGMTPAELRAAIEERLSVYLKSPVVTVERVKPGEVVGIEMEEVELATRVFPLKYADAENMSNALAGVVSAVGSIRPDPNTNAIIATDSPENLVGIGNVIAQLDASGRAASQVLIETLMIEVQEEAAEEFGVRWFFDRPGSTKGWRGSFRTQENFPPQGDVINDTLLQLTHQSLAAGASLFFGKHFDTYRLFMTLDALINDQKATVLAHPSVIVENHKQAKIDIITKFPYRELSRSSIQQAGDLVFTTQFLDIGVSLSVTPHIRRDNIVFMELYPEVSFIQGESEDIPIKASRSASTSVNVEDGTTFVIGGLTQERNVKTIHKIPILGDIPLLKFFFRHKEMTKEKTQLMIFVTPHIVENEEMKRVSSDTLEEYQLASLDMQKEKY